MTNKKKRGAAYKPTIDPARKRWVRTDNIEFVHYAVPDGEREGGEGALEGWGDTHMVSLFTKRAQAQRAFTVDFSEMTSQELQAVKEFYEKVFAEAQKVCEHRDQLAREAFEHGDDTIYRLYRTVPKVVEREGPKPQHSEGEGG